MGNFRTDSRGCVLEYVLVFMCPAEYCGKFGSGLASPREFGCSESIGESMHVGDPVVLGQRSGPLPKGVPRHTEILNRLALIEAPDWSA